MIHRAAGCPVYSGGTAVSCAASRIFRVFGRGAALDGNGAFVFFVLISGGNCGFTRFFGFYHTLCGDGSDALFAGVPLDPAGSIFKLKLFCIALL